MKVLILAPYPVNEGPSQRFRYEQYLSYLAQHDIHCDTQSFWNLATWQILYKKGYTVKKISGFITGWWRRFAMLFSLNKYDIVFIQREAAPVGPPVIEWLIAKVWSKKIIYDFDDAVWLPNATSTNPLLRILKWHGKVSGICRWSWKVSCGNDFLAAYALRFNKNVFVIPTTIDTNYHKQKNVEARFDKPVIGWTGSQSTNEYLKSFDEILFALKKRCDFEFVVISNQPPQIKFPVTFIKWSRENEIEDLSQLSIGIMPLPDNDWSRGKCGFKLLQYLSLNIPAVASRVGVNVNIVTDNETGFTATTNDEWVSALEHLITDSGLRTLLGNNGRERVQKYYSVNAWKDEYVKLFR